MGWNNKEKVQRESSNPKVFHDICGRGQGNIYWLVANLLWEKFQLVGIYCGKMISWWEIIVGNCQLVGNYCGKLLTGGKLLWENGKLVGIYCGKMVSWWEIIVGKFFADGKLLWKVFNWWESIVGHDCLMVEIINRINFWWKTCIQLV